jgi:hypothetical protein
MPDGWKLAVYEEYIVALRNRIPHAETPEIRERDEILLNGWIALRQELESEPA